MESESQSELIYEIVVCVFCANPALVSIAMGALWSSVGNWTDASEMHRHRPLKALIFMKNVIYNFAFPNY